MSYVYMKVLESAPSRYDRGMKILTLGRLQRAKEDIAALIEPGERGSGEDFRLSSVEAPSRTVLDIGCGTGTLALLMARRGVQVVGIDISAPMLAIAREKVQEAGLGERIELRELGAVDLDTAFEDESFDTITSTLTFSELSDDEIDYTLRHCHRILKSRGKLIIADEILPLSLGGRMLTFLFRLPFVILTFLLTQNTTKRVANLEERIEGAGFRITGVRKYLLGTLRTFVAVKGTRNK
ncbi:MAG: corrinoid protein-associated methyltransferase CpaM [Anaerolineae bacterium]